MAGIIQGGEVPFSGPQAGRLPEDILEEGTRQLMDPHPMGQTQLTIDVPDPYGFSSTPPDEIGQNDRGPTLEEQLELEQLRQSQVQPQVEQNWQALYGRSENEKGELRRQLQAAQEAQAQLALQQQMFQAQMQSMMANQNRPQPAHNPQAYGPAPQLFQGKPVDEPLYIRDVEERVTPILHGLYQEVQAANQRNQMLEDQLIASRKLQAGITPMQEFQILAENPWINTLQGSSKVDAMASVAALKRAQTTQAAPPQPPPYPTQPQATQGVRRILHLGEPGQAPRVNPEPRVVDPNLSMQQEWAATMQLPVQGGQREAAQKAVLLKYGAQQHTGWRDPNVLTR